MIIKSAQLETVCGITSTFPKYPPGICFRGKIQCREVLPDQWPDEPEVLGPDLIPAREDPDR